MNDRGTILLTGGAGFLGSNLLRELLNLKYSVVLLLRKSSKIDKIKSLLNSVDVVYSGRDIPSDLFMKHHIEGVIHCATNYGREGQSPVAILETNLVLPLRLLQMGAENGLKYFINTDTVLRMDINHYALSKAQFKDWLKLYSKQLSCVNIALEHFYGPGDDESKFVTWIIRMLLREPKTIALTPGEQRREFVYIDDVVSAFMKLLSGISRRKNGFISYEVGTDRPVRIKDFVFMVKELAGNSVSKLDLGAIPYRDGEVINYKTNLSGIKSLGWKNRVSLRSGLLRTIAFERAQLGLGRR